MNRLVVALFAAILTVIGCSGPRVGEGYLPTHPFPPLPVDAKVYVGEGKAIFKKDAQTAEEMAEIDALARLTNDFTLHVRREIEKNVKDVTNAGEGVRVYNVLEQIQYEGPIPGRKFKDQAVNEKTGQVIVRIYISSYDADEIVVPYYLNKLKAEHPADYIEKAEERYLQLFYGEQYQNEKERNFQVLQEFNYRVQQELQERIL